MRRVFIKDQLGEFYRPFSFYIEPDRKGEFYVKVSFPDLSNKPLMSTDIPVGTKDYAPKDRASYHEERSISEFSYHYLSGVSHFKTTGDGNRIHSQRNLPCLRDGNVLNIIRVNLFDLSTMNPCPVPKRFDDENMLLLDSFDGAPRSIDIYLKKLTTSVNLRNADPNKTLLHSYTTVPMNTDAHFLILDWKMRESEFQGGISVFLYNNPEQGLES